MEVEESANSIKEEIINHLLSEEYLEGAISQNANTLDYQQQPYGATLQAYLFQRSPGPEQVTKLYTIQRDKKVSKSDRVSWPYKRVYRVISPG